MFVLFQLQISAHVGPVHVANVFTCWAGLYWKCPRMLVLLQMSTRNGTDPSANVFTFWSVPILQCKCPHMSVLFPLQMSTRFVPVHEANVFLCWSCSYFKCLHVSCSYCKCLHVLVSTWCSIGYLLLDLIFCIFNNYFWFWKFLNNIL